MENAKGSPGHGAEVVVVDERVPVEGPPRGRPVPAAPDPTHLTLERELGRGGMGQVHVAADRMLLRQVAVKHLMEPYAGAGMYRDGFVAEAQIAGQLEHPNIVPVHELSVDPKGVLYFTMKYVRGESFLRWLYTRSRPPGSTERLSQGLEIFLKLCDAVAYAHHRGVIHRDLKPENIMVGAFGQVYLMDWGLALLTKSRPASGEKAQMMAEGPVGTPHYMAPEQAAGDPRNMDERTDIFGLGAVLFEIVSGIPPYGDVAFEVAMDRAKRGAIIPIDEACRRVGVSARIRNITAKAVHPDPAQRYQTVVELQRDVRSFLQGGLHLPRKAFAPGTPIIREGEAGEAAYMIVAGRCRAYRTVQGQKETLTVMEPGEVFGEMALLLDEPRNATVEAVDKVTLLVLDRETLTEGLGMNGWSGALVRALAKRFRDLEQKVRDSGIAR